MASAGFAPRFGDLLRARPGAAARWLAPGSLRSWLEPLALIMLCGALHGAAMGLWRAPLLALYVALKLPLLFLLTAMGNALAYGLWARRLGLELSFGASLRAVLLGFSLAAVVLAGLAPVLLFLSLTLQGPADPRALAAHNFLGLAHVAAVALAGTLALREQFGWLQEIEPRARLGTLVVLAWLALDLVLGAQLSWNLRPWFGTPSMPVAFLRERPFDGTFYESVFHMLFHL